MHIDQGADYAALVRVTDPAGGDVDLSGYSATAQLRRSFADVAPLTLTFGVVMGASELTLGLTKEQTALLTFGVYAWDCKLIDGTGNTQRLLGGGVQIAHEVTREEAVA